jgi:YVTN family beta-propeller protein
MRSSKTEKVAALVCAWGVLAGMVGIGFLAQKRANAGKQVGLIPLPTGKFITPEGRQINVGSFPANMIVTPDGRHIVVTNTGFRQFLTVIRIEDGIVTAQLEVGKARAGKKPDKEGLYYGLTARPAEEGKTTLYASRGNEDRVQILTLNADGTFGETEKFVDNPSEVAGDATPHAIAGVAVSADGTTLYAVNNHTDANTSMQGSLSILDIATNRLARKVTLPGFPFAVAYLPTQNGKPAKVYVSSERDSVVSVVEVDRGVKVRDIKVGMHAMSLLFDKAKKRLFVANAGSDTISVIDTEKDRVVQTILVRPDDVRGLPGVTPTNLALSPDEQRLYVTCADMNAVAVVSLPDGALKGYIPVGWYPTAAAVSPDGKRLFVANAKGINARNPNGSPAGPDGKWGQYIQNIIEGTIAVMDIPPDTAMDSLTRRVIVNNRITPDTEKRNAANFVNPGIEHVIYIIKENRTYDQVLGDLPQGNGDPKLCLFPREVTPNQHALAERFVLLDNFHVCAEVSADGWDWSVSGMISEYTARNAPYNYSGRGRSFDFEGQNNGVPVDLLGIPDVARAPSGYIWDLCAKHKVSYRNYGCYGNFVSAEVRTKEGGKWTGEDNAPNKKALVGHSDTDFRIYDLTYADSDLWLKYNCPSPNQKKSYGKFNAPSRFSEWKREFDEFVKNKNLPRFSIIRFGRDHTSGTRAGAPTPQAMVAENDYAVGQLVEAVSKSPYWQKTAIFILEDDAQNGYDHIDAHRSIAFVISPYIKKGTIDSTFYNTDSVLRTMELLLGLPPMCQYDAVANPMRLFGTNLVNEAPYTAILPAREIAAAVNQATAYRANDSARLINPLKEESMPDEELNDILWRSIRGVHSTPPPVRYSLRMNPEREEDEEDD